MQFSNVVKQKLNKKRLKISDLAKQVGYSTQYISDLLSGKRRWNETVIDKVCQALDIKISFTM